MNPKVILLTIFFASLVLWAHARRSGPEANANSKNDIKGSVVQSFSKKPLSHVSITAYISSKKEKAMATDNNGNYSFDELRSGIYTFVFEKDGFKKVTKEGVVIKADEAFMLNIEMMEYKDYEFLPHTLHLFDGE